MRFSGASAALCVLALAAAPSVWGQTPPPASAAAAPTSAAPSVRLTGYLQAREAYRNDVGLTAPINRARLTALWHRGQGRDLAGPG